MEFTSILDEFNVSYVEEDLYLKVGLSQQDTGWIIHITCVISKIVSLLRIAAPRLFEAGVSFKVIKNKETTRLLMDGSLGYARVGKAIIVYAGDGSKAQSLAELLAQITGGFFGPAVPTDALIIPPLYARYGPYAVDEEGTFGAFEVPHEVTWPFSKWSEPAPNEPANLRRHGYQVVSVLKADTRGAVVKAIYWKRLFKIAKCVIKEGKHHMVSDGSGRDIRDRLIWQQELHDRLRPVIPLPKVLRLFEEKGNLYLAIEFIEGSSLNDLRFQLGSRAWFALNYVEKTFLTNILGDIIVHLRHLHEQGLVHRDVTPVNFLVTKEGEVRPIDIELAYDLHSERLLPPFGLGTPGYMSPEQYEGLCPTIKEDIYGLSGTIIYALTGLSPTKFTTQNPLQLEDKLAFYIGKNALARELALGLHSEPASRPNLENLQQALLEFQARLQDKDREKGQSVLTYDQLRPVVKAAIQRSIKSLICPPLLTKDGIWVSSTIVNGGEIINELRTYEIYPGLMHGIAGVMKALALAKMTGFDISPCVPAYTSAAQYLAAINPETPGRPFKGLYSGKAGIATSIAAGIKAGLVEESPASLQFLEACLTEQPVDPTLSSGAAGIIIAALGCQEYCPEKFYNAIIHLNVDHLIRRQDNSGGWITKNELGQDRSLSFCFGTAGIVYALLELYKRSKDQKVENSIRRGLQWLSRKTANLDRVLLIEPAEDPTMWEKLMDDGPIGLMITYIKAYEILKEPVFRLIAEKALLAYPEQFVTNNLAQNGGLAGLAELYSEAFRVFGNAVYLNRLNWIASQFVNLAVAETEEDTYWVTGQSAYQTADFMAGHAGILNCLIRYLYPNAAGYRAMM